MTLTTIGVGSSDFLNTAIADFGESITHVPVTETEDVRGNKVQVYSGTHSITAHLMMRSKTFIRDKFGVQELSPAYMMSIATDGIKRNDMVIASVGTFKVFNAIPREAPASGLYVYSELYLWE